MSQLTVDVQASGRYLFEDRSTPIDSISGERPEEAAVRRPWPVERVGHREVHAVLRPFDRRRDRLCAAVHRGGSGRGHPGRAWTPSPRGATRR